MTNTTQNTEATKKIAKQMHNFDFACYTLSLTDTGIPIDETRRDFDFDAYSQFKHGSISAAKKFARIMTRDLMVHFPDMFTEYKYDELAIVPFPFKELKTAAGQLCREMVKYLNLHLDIEGLPPAIIINMYKFPGKPSEEHHYPSMNYEQRQKILANCDICIDVNRLAKIKKLIIVDDVFVTGASAVKVQKYLETLGFEGEIKFVYIAKIDPDTAKYSPQIESVINHHFIKFPMDLLPFMENRDFDWNIRCLKFVLESNSSDFSLFLDRANPALIFDMFSHCLSMNYKSEKKYTTNLRMLRQVVTQHGLNMF